MSGYHCPTDENSPPGGFAVPPNDSLMGPGDISFPVPPRRFVVPSNDTPLGLLQQQTLGSQAPPPHASAHLTNTLQTMDWSMGYAPQNAPNPGIEWYADGQLKYPAFQNRETADRLRATRVIDGKLCWFDWRDNYWKPAGYHHIFRAELIKLAAQQPGAPEWTEDKGTDFTSFSRLTQGWSELRDSVIDGQGRPVFHMPQHPADWDDDPDYGYLLYNGIIMLDNTNRPVRDIPGVTLTFASQTPIWYLAGLQRCVAARLSDIAARFPGLAKGVQGPKMIYLSNLFPKGINDWLTSQGIALWPQRPTFKEHNPNQESLQQPPFPINGRVEGETPGELNLLGSNSFDGEDTQRQRVQGGMTAPWNGYGHIPREWVIRGNARQYNQQSATSQYSMMNGLPSDWTGQGVLPSFDQGNSTAQMLMGNGLPNDWTGQGVLPSFDQGNSTAQLLMENGLPSDWTGQGVLPSFDQGNSTAQLLMGNGLQNAQAYQMLGRPAHPADARNDFFLDGDFRYAVPHSSGERHFVQYLLRYTRAQFRTLAAMEPPITSRYESYAYQYGELQAQFEVYWNAIYPYIPPIKLKALRPVEGGPEHW